MSHTTKYKINIVDAECAVKALKRMGFTETQIENHEQEVGLNDYNGRSMGLKANVVIRKQNLRGCVNDFGIRIGDDGSEVYVDGNTVDTKRLEQCYGVEKTLKDSEAMGYFAVEEVQSDGRITLRLRR